MKVMEAVSVIERCVEIIGIPTLVATGPDYFGDYNLTPKGETAAIAAVVSNLRDPDVVKASAILIATLWHFAPEITASLRALASKGGAE